MARQGRSTSWAAPVRTCWHGQIAYATRRGSDAPPLLLKAAKQFERLDIQLARETYLDAFSAALFAGRLASGGGTIVEVAQAVVAADWGVQAPPRRGCDLLLDGLAPGHHPGLRGGHAAAEAGADHHPRTADVRRGITALAVAGLPHRAGHRRRRELGRADRPAGPGGPTGRRPLGTSDRAHRTIQRGPLQRQARGGDVSGRRVGSRDRGDR